MSPRVKSAHRSSHCICRAQNPHHIMPVTLWPQAWSEFCLLQWSIGRDRKPERERERACKTAAPSEAHAKIWTWIPAAVAFIVVEGFSVDVFWPWMRAQRGLDERGHSLREEQTHAAISMAMNQKHQAALHPLLFLFGYRKLPEWSCTEGKTARAIPGESTRRLIPASLTSRLRGHRWLGLQPLNKQASA